MIRRRRTDGSLAGARLAPLRAAVVADAADRDRAAVLFALGAAAPTRLASEFVLRLGNEGLLLGILALSVAFLMNQAGLVALGAASVYGGAGYLFAIAMSEWDMTAGRGAGRLASSIIVAYAAILGALIVRTNPLAFMMLTLAAGEMISHGVMLEGAARLHRRRRRAGRRASRARFSACRRRISPTPRVSGRSPGRRPGYRD